MQRVGELIFYDLAIKVHGLTELEAKETAYNDLVWVLGAARDALNGIYRSRPLLFSAQSTWNLYNHIGSIVPLDFNDMVAKMDPESSQKISWWEINQIKQYATEFEIALKTECALMDAYYVVKKGAFSTKDLIENAHHQIPLPSRSLISDIAKSDFYQAGKCLAFDVYTAAAFHLLRGTESVVREYYALAVPGPNKLHRKCETGACISSC